MRQRFQGIQFLHQHIFFGQADDACRQRDADEQHKPLGQHAKQPGGRPYDALKKQIAPKKIGLDEEQDAKRQDKIAGKARHLAHRGEEL